MRKEILCDVRDDIRSRRTWEKTQPTLEKSVGFADPETESYLAAKAARASKSVKKPDRVPQEIGNEVDAAVLDQTSRRSNDPLVDDV